MKEIVAVDLPRPRDQIATKELPEFAHLRAHVYRLIKRDAGDRGARCREVSDADTSTRSSREALIVDVTKEDDRT